MFGFFSGFFADSETDRHPQITRRFRIGKINDKRLQFDNLFDIFVIGQRVFRLPTSSFTFFFALLLAESFFARDFLSLVFDSEAVSAAAAFDLLQK